jgi:inward rectifier potassium channel
MIISFPSARGDRQTKSRADVSAARVEMGSRLTSPEPDRSLAEGDPARKRGLALGPPNGEVQHGFSAGRGAMQDEISEHPAASPHPKFGVGAVPQVGLHPDGWSDAYHWLLVMPPWAFLAALALTYAAINVLFAGLYMLDPRGVANARPGDFTDAFFFSAQTLGSVGYGALWPRSLYVNCVATTEMFVGLCSLGAATGLLFARISRPTARIMFSRRAVVAPLNGVPALMFRAANRRRNLVVEAEVSVTLIHDVRTLEGVLLRRFDELPVVRSRTPLFSLTWQVMHRIDADSPLHGENAESLSARNAEILVVMKGLDETFVSTIHARTSYRPDEIVWGRSLADIFITGPEGLRAIDFRRFHDIE